MFLATQRSNGGTANLSQMLAHEQRLNRLHRLFKTHFNVTEPSLVLEPFLFLGNCISAQDVHRLQKLGIRYVLNVAKRDVELCPYYSKDMRTLTIDLRDDDRENILRTFDQAFAFIDEARKLKSRVLVHCSHGQSRSPAIVIAYLMRTYNTSLEQCLVHVVRARPCVIPNDGFLKQLILYDRFLVERRRKQEVARIQEVNNEASTEIEIQYHSPVVPLRVQPIPPTILTPPKPPTISTYKATSISSMDSSSMGLSSTSSVPSSTSTNPIKVIPIQIQAEEPSPIKIEPVPIDNKNSAEDTSKKVEKPQEKPARRKSSDPSIKTRLHSSLSQNILTAPEKPTVKKIIGDKQLPPRVVRSNTVNLHIPIVNHRNQSSSILTPQQWNFIDSYSAKHAQSNYIIEVYDRATNRFVPTTRCY